jgi:hypothetical protein
VIYVNRRSQSIDVQRARLEGKSLVIIHYIYHIDTSRLYSCSLPCFKKHKSICSRDQSATKESAHEEVEPIQNDVLKQTAEEELNELFQKYPQLRSKLDAVYQETLDPQSRRIPSQPPRNRRFDYRWTEEKGFEQGLRTLKAKLDTDSHSQNDLRAFAALVSRRSEGT